MIGHTYTPKEWLDKADYEGGLEEAILGYGLTENSLDKDAAPDLWEAIKNFRVVAAPVLDDLQAAAIRYGW